MVPAQAPLPTDCRFPFHPVSGSQTSILISESLTGVRVAATRQNAGRFWNDGGLLAFRACGTGGVKAPAATASAVVMVVFLSFSAVRLSHVEAPKTGAIPNAAMASRSVIVIAGVLVMMEAAPY